MIIGFFAILLEIMIVKSLSPINVLFEIKMIFGFVLGVLFSFFLNAKLNFKVPKSKNVKTFLLFLTISVIAFTLNLLLIWVFRETIQISYAYLRLITAAIIFTLSYTAHRKFTFDFIKKVGLAVYLNKEEDISRIYSKIKYYSDFIHIDLVDKTFKKDAKEIDLKLMDGIDKTWGLKKMLHIMSTEPSIWINKLASRVDIILFHLEINEDIEKNISLCKSHNKSVGLVLNENSKIEDLLKYLPKIDFVQVMGIGSLGKSGQRLNLSSLEKVNRLNELKKRYSFEIVFDGGVKPTNINRINAKYVVSASGMLKTNDPINAFMELKSSSRNKSFYKSIKRDIFLGMKKTIELMDFVESATVVGSFAEGRGLKGINDIDMIVIVDELTKKKFKEILEKFENLKEDIESKYAWPVYINNTLGPLKFNAKNIVFHLMIYDKKTHKEHCIKSPFTCFDWQTSKFFFKKPMSEIYRVWDLQLKDFFSARRSAEEYLKDLKSNKISYRIYGFKGNNVIEKTEYKVMNNRDKIEFSCHIIKFLIMNFLKVYYNKNYKESFKKSVERYFQIFPDNKRKHIKLIEKIFKIKENREFNKKIFFNRGVERFVKDFEYQFKQLFEIK